MSKLKVTKSESNERLFQNVEIGEVFTIPSLGSRNHVYMKLKKSQETFYNAVNLEGFSLICVGDETRVVLHEANLEVQ